MNTNLTAGKPRSAFSVCCRRRSEARSSVLVADRYSGSFAAGGYLGVYSRMQVGVSHHGRNRGAR